LPFVLTAAFFRSDDDFEFDDEVANDTLVTSPFNLDDISVAHEVDSDDAILQEAIFDGLFLQQEGAPVDGPTWEQTPVTTLNLSSLERMYRINDRSSAIYRVISEIGFKVVEKYLLLAWYISWRVLLGMI
jgi:hypothetical protein